MNLFSNCLVLAVFMIFIAGCAQTRYAWEDYDQKLYDHYKNPAEYDEFVVNLQEVILEGEDNNKVPPGMYAEFGYVLYEKGNFPEAISYFKKEQDKWPESRVLMTKMISNAQKRSTQREKQKEASIENPGKSAEVAK